MARRRKIATAALPKDRVSVNTLTQKSLAWACVHVWRRMDGRDRSFMMRHASIDVPYEVLAQARDELNSKRNKSTEV